MKTKIYSVLLFASILSCIQFIACKKNCDPNNPPDGETVNLGQEDKLFYFPFKDFDTIKFIKNNTDTVLFLGNKFETGYNKAFNQDPNCPGLDKLQYMKLFFANNSNGTITFYEYTLSQALGNFTKYSITYNDRIYGPTGETNSFTDSTNIYIMGVDYKDVFKFNGKSTTDNLFFVHNVGVIKIIYKGDTYEKLP